MFGAVEIRTEPSPCVAPTALRPHFHSDPALPDRASYCRAYGAGPGPEWLRGPGSPNAENVNKARRLVELVARGGIANFYSSGNNLTARYPPTRMPGHSAHTLWQEDNENQH